MGARAGHIGLAIWLLAAPAAAQTPASRAAEIARQQEEKARALAPYQRNWWENQLLAIEEAGGTRSWERPRK